MEQKAYSTCSGPAGPFTINTVRNYWIYNTLHHCIRCNFTSHIKTFACMYEYLLSNGSNIIGNMHNSIYLVYKCIK